MSLLWLKQICTQALATTLKALNIISLIVTLYMLLALTFVHNHNIGVFSRVDLIEAAEWTIHHWAYWTQVVVHSFYLRALYVVSILLLVFKEFKVLNFGLKFKLNFLALLVVGFICFLSVLSLAYL